MSVCLVSFSADEGPRKRSGLGEQRRPGGLCAFSLIEVVAVLAILAILAAAVLPALIRQIDYASEGTEATNLVALATGFTQAASAQRYIPSQANWDAFIATNIGWQLTSVQTNSRHNARVFLIDTNLLIATTAGTTTAATLPYKQPAIGATNIANPRFIILSSLSSPLPVSSGVPSSSDFNALWDATNDTIPAVSWSGSWSGQAADLKIQRITLASSFVHLVLSDLDPPPPLPRRIV